MVGSEAISRTIRRGAQIVIIDSSIANAPNTPRIFLREEKHVRRILYLGFLLKVHNGGMVFSGHVPPCTAVEIGIHAVTILRLDGNRRTITIMAAHLFGNNFECGTQVNIPVLQIRPEYAAEVRIRVKILAGIMPSAPSAAVLVEPGK